MSFTFDFDCCHGQPYYRCRYFYFRTFHLRTIRTRYHSHRLWKVVVAVVLVLCTLDFLTFLLKFFVLSLISQTIQIETRRNSVEPLI